MSEGSQMLSEQSDQIPVGDADQSQANESSKDSVAYSTYSRTVGEAKKAKALLAEKEAELEKLRLEAKERHEKELQAQNKWQELAKQKEQEAQEALNKVQSYEQREIASRKLDKVLSGVGDPIDQKYWGLIDIDSVEYDPSTGEFDESSLNKEVQRIKNELPEILSRKTNANFDPSAPQKTGSNKLDLDKFARMSKQEKKEQLKNLDAPDWMK